MAFSATQIATGVSYMLATHEKKTPIDQISYQHVTLDWLVKNKKESTFGNGSFKEPVFYRNQSNYQNYQGADQVTYNERDPAKWTDFTYYSFHDGFWFDEDRLLAAGIELSDDGTPSAAEKSALIELVDTSFMAMKSGIQENLAFETLRDGSQSTKACPGLASLVDPTPATGTVGGIDASTASYWQNNANLTFTAANVVAEMEEMWTSCIRYGGAKPDFIVCGRAFYDNYVTYAASAVQRHQAVGGNGSVVMDPTIASVNFRGVPVVWDPTFEALDTLLGTTTQTKTVYMLNSKHINLRAVKGQWMKDRKPASLPDRYVTYYGRTGKFGMTTNKRNALAVGSIA